MRMKTLPYLLLPLLALPAATSAQSLMTRAGVGVANTEYNGLYHILALAFDEAEAGLAAEAELAPTPFAGLDASGSTQTQTFDGRARGGVDFGHLRVSASGALRNTFYNPSNPPYWNPTVTPPVVDPEGTPDRYYAYGLSEVTELLAFGGFGVGNYRARHVYYVTGHVQGDGFSSAYVTYQVGMNPIEIETFTPNLANGSYAGYFATQLYPVASFADRHVRTQFYVWYETSTMDWPEGSDVIGNFDFGSTVRLDRIEVFDEDNNEVFGWTVTGASGTNYDFPIFRGDFDGFQEAPESTGPALARGCSGLYRLEHDGNAAHRVPLCESSDVGSIREVILRPR